MKGDLSKLCSTSKILLLILKVFLLGSINNDTKFHYEFYKVYCYNFLK